MNQLHVCSERSLHLLHVLMGACNNLLALYFVNMYSNLSNGVIEVYSDNMLEILRQQQHIAPIDAVSAFHCF